MASRGANASIWTLGTRVLTHVCAILHPMRWEQCPEPKGRRPSGLPAGSCAPGSIFQAQDKHTGTPSLQKHPHGHSATCVVAVSWSCLWGRAGISPAPPAPPAWVQAAWPRACTRRRAEPRPRAPGPGAVAMGPRMGGASLLPCGPALWMATCCPGRRRQAAVASSSCAQRDQAMLPEAGDHPPLGRCWLGASSRASHSQSGLFPTKPFCLAFKSEQIIPPHPLASQMRV